MVLLLDHGTYPAHDTQVTAVSYIQQARSFGIPENHASATPRHIAVYTVPLV